MKKPKSFSPIEKMSLVIAPGAAEGDFSARGISGPGFDILIASFSGDLLFAPSAGSIFFTNDRMPKTKQFERKR